MAELWLVFSTPVAQTTAADIQRHVADHLAWKRTLEGTIVLSGPLVSGPATGPGSGVTVLRAGSAERARAIASTDPFVVAGLRTFEVFGWQAVEEGT